MSWVWGGILIAQVSARGGLSRCHAGTSGLQAGDCHDDERNVGTKKGLCVGAVVMLLINGYVEPLFVVYRWPLLTDWVMCC